MYLCVISIDNERSQRLSTHKSRSECAEFIFKLKEYMNQRGVKLSAEVYWLGLPVETIT
jgi:hypothetical protein